MPRDLFLSTRPRHPETPSSCPKTSHSILLQKSGPLDPPPVLEPLSSPEPQLSPFLWLTGAKLLLSGVHVSHLGICWSLPRLFRKGQMPLSVTATTGPMTHHPSCLAFRDTLLSQEAGPTSPPCPLGNQATQLSPTIQTISRPVSFKECV